METAQFKYTSKYSKNVIDEILKIKESYGLTPSNLIKYSKPNGELRKLFEWDNKKCGDKWREQQARIIINEIKIIIEDKEIFAFENISVDVDSQTRSTREYFDTFEILEDSSKCNQVSKRAYEEIIYWLNKYEYYLGDNADFSGIINEIKKIKNRI